jgi:hypothetical protein
LIPNPIRKVLFSIRARRVRALLMGGQACVLYGAAEFSRDTDFVILAQQSNLSKLRRALADLQAVVIAVPPFHLKHLRKGHAIHFRCHHPEALCLRVDVMSKMRGVDSFDNLWRRRSTILLADGARCDLLSLPDLVQAKKTQRDKDWPMIRRLVEAHYFQNNANPRPAQIRFWFQELRTPQLLIELAQQQQIQCRRLIPKRPLLSYALSAAVEKLDEALAIEEKLERERDRLYWFPLKKEIEKLRHSKFDDKKRGRPRHRSSTQP